MIHLITKIQIFIKVCFIKNIIIKGKTGNFTILSKKNFQALLGENIHTDFFIIGDLNTATLQIKKNCKFNFTKNCQTLQKRNGMISFS